MMNTSALLISLLVTSILPGIGALFLFMRQPDLQKILLYLVALSTGAIFGGTFIHLIPKYANSIGFTHATGVLVIIGIAVSHLLEKVIHWHCHRIGHDVEPFSYMILIGDSLHNIIDGILIAASYLISVPAGVAATVVVALHKIPKEVGDFGALVHGGLSRMKALLFNIGVSIFMFLGAGLVFLLTSFEQMELFLIPFAIGNFVYIAGTDLFPELKAAEGNRRSAIAFTFFLIGAGLMYGIVFVEPMLT